LGRRWRSGRRRQGKCSSRRTTSRPSFIGEPCGGVV